MIPAWEEEKQHEVLDFLGSLRVDQLLRAPYLLLVLYSASIQWQQESFCPNQPFFLCLLRPKDWSTVPESSQTSLLLLKDSVPERILLHRAGWPSSNTHALPV